MKNTFVTLQAHTTNVVRAVTPPYQYYSHLVNGKRKSCTAKLIAGCQECLKEKPQPRWILGVIDRSNGKYSVLDINAGLFRKIQDLVRDPDYGDPQKYDMEITINDIRLGKDPSSAMYTVAAGEQYSESIDETERNDLKLKILKLTDPICIELDNIYTQDAFKSFYISNRLDSSVVELLTKMVPKWYPQYQETLQKLITFS